MRLSAHDNKLETFQHGQVMSLTLKYFVGKV